MHNIQHDRKELKRPNLNPVHEHKDNAEVLMQNSGLESNDPNCVSNRNGKVVKES